ncbi:hypothetical protein KCU65_g125, partial [Aureobasidium melanogenum]
MFDLPSECVLAHDGSRSAGSVAKIEWPIEKRPVAKADGEETDARALQERQDSELAACTGQVQVQTVRQTRKHLGCDALESSRGTSSEFTRRARTRSLPKAKILGGKSYGTAHHLRERNTALSDLYGREPCSIEVLDVELLLCNRCQSRAVPFWTFSKE